MSSEYVPETKRRKQGRPRTGYDHLVQARVTTKTMDAIKAEAAETKDSVYLVVRRALEKVFG